MCNNRNKIIEENLLDLKELAIFIFANENIEIQTRNNNKELSFKNSTGEKINIVFSAFKQIFLHGIKTVVDSLEKKQTTREEE